MQQVFPALRFHPGARKNARFSAEVTLRTGKRLTVRRSTVEKAKEALATLLDGMDLSQFHPTTVDVSSLCPRACAMIVSLTTN